MRRTALLLTTLALLASAGSAGAATDQTGPAEQLLIHRINLARWDPAGFGDEMGLPLSGILPRPPLAVSEVLGGSARFKADEMMSHGYFAHRSAVTGLWPNRLARNHGYPLPALFPDDANNIESLAAAPDPLSAFLQSGHHRAHLLGTADFFAGHREVGVGRSGTGDYWVVHTAYASSGDTFITGVVYRDGNGNGRMDLGEGLPGITVTAGSHTVTTNPGGGYRIEASPGRHRLTASGPGFAGTSRGTVRIHGSNVGADFVSGRPEPVVRDYRLCLDREPTILGTGGDDTIWGTDGRDVIHGLDGDDTIYGLAGNDIICGGGGDDVIDGGEGDDRIRSQSRNDTVDGGPGNDVVFAGPGRDVVAGGEGDDRLYGEDHDDHLSGGPGADVVGGGPGGDLLDPGDGNDRLYGSDGRDRFLAGPGDNEYWGGRGRDAVDYRRAPAGVVVDLGAGTGDGTGTDTLHHIENIRGSAGADVLVGDGADNQLRGFGGDDLLIGAGGDDLLIGGAGDDELDGGDGIDTCRRGFPVDCEPETS